MKLPRLSFAHTLLAALSVVLIGDSLVLLCYLKINTGSFMPGIIGLFLLCPILLRQRFGQYMQHRTFALFWRTAQAALLIFLAGLAAFVGYALARQADPAGPPPDAIVVLGAGLREGTPSPMLANRLDVAGTLAQRFAATPIIVSGGHGMLEATSEAIAMRHYLETRGVARTRILLEDRSTSTYENLEFSRAVLVTHGIDITSADILIVTSDFHVLRAGQIAHRAGYAHARLMAAATPLSILPNVWLREYLAYIKAMLTGEI